MQNRREGFVVNERLADDARFLNVDCGQFIGVFGSIESAACRHGDGFHFLLFQRSVRRDADRGAGHPRGLHFRQQLGIRRPVIAVADEDDVLDGQSIRWLG